MIIELNHGSQDTGVLIITPGEDDHFEVSGYGNRDGVKLKLPLYAQEAAELIEVLQPLADQAEDKEFQNYDYDSAPECRD